MPAIGKDIPCVKMLLSLTQQNPGHLFGASLGRFPASVLFQVIDPLIHSTRRGTPSPVVPTFQPISLLATVPRLHLYQTGCTIPMFFQMITAHHQKAFRCEYAIFRKIRRGHYSDNQKHPGRGYAETTGIDSRCVGETERTRKLSDSHPCISPLHGA
jgi:hypothetical protein